jgi:DNA-binding NarL/FixJ family response regulator
MEGLKVAVVAGSEPLRIGLASIIESHPGLALAGEAKTFSEVVLDRRFHDADVVLLDVRIADETPIDVLEKAARAMPGMRLLLLGGDQDQWQMDAEGVPAYMRLNAVGFVSRDVTAERLVEAIDLLASGVFVCEMDVIRSILMRLVRWVNESPEPKEGQLTERELEVLRLVAEGRSNREIAQELFLSEGTVKIHVSHIMSKLSMERRTELVRYALQRGLAPM